LAIAVSRGLSGLFISPGFAANCSGLLLLLLFGKTARLDSYCCNWGDSRFLLACYGDSHSGCLPADVQNGTGSFEQIDAILTANPWGVGSNSILAGHLPLSGWPGCRWNRSLLPALGEFGATLMLAGNIPGQTQTIPVAIYFAVEAGDMKQASIWVLVISISLSHHREFWSDSRHSVAVRARGGKEQEKQGELGPSGDKGEMGEPHPKRRKGLL